MACLWGVSVHLQRGNKRMQPLKSRRALRRRVWEQKKIAKLTELGELLLVGLVGNDGLLGSLGLLDGLLNSEEPAVALRGSLGLEGVLAAVELEVESNGAVLGELGRISLYMLAVNSSKSYLLAYQVQDTSGGGLLVGVLDEEKQALAGDARPGGGGVRNFGLLTTEVLTEAGCGDSGLLAEPEVLLGETERTVELSDEVSWAGKTGETHFLRPGALYPSAPL